MTLVTEDGTGLANSDSYVSAADCVTYATNRGLIFTADATGDQALRKATAYIDNAYRLRFGGYRTNRRAQALEWPRALAFYFQPDPQMPSPFFIDPRATYPYDVIAPNIVPIEVRNATCEAAIREQASPGILLPDLDRGGMIAEVKAGSVGVKYAPGADPNTVFQVIEAVLSALIGRVNAYSAMSVRV